MTDREQYRTEKFDEKFADAAADGLRWYPWVGNDYETTGILIVGRSTYYIESEGWSSDWKKYCDTSVYPNHSLVGSCLSGQCDHKPFYTMAKMFLDGAGQEYKSTRAKFWSSVAFLNFCQKIVKGVSEPCEDHENSKAALQKAIAILKPKLIVAWTTELWSVGLPEDEFKTRDAKVNGAWPRVSNALPPIVGVKHPSWCFSGPKWLEFLRNDPASKEPIAALLQHLRD